MDIGKPVYPTQPGLRNYLVVAALLHFILIAGVTFKAATRPASDQAPTLEALLVAGDKEDEKRHRPAAYISTQTQQGAGTGEDKKRTSLPEASLYVEDSQGTAQGTAFSQTSPRTTTQRAIITYLGSGKTTPEGDLVEHSRYHAEPIESRPVLSTGASANDEELHLRGKEKFSGLQADTQASVMALYLQDWKNRVEYIGTLNFPNSAKHRTLTGSPVIEVEISADGTLRRVFLRKSSGFQDLDRAALTIVRMASPFSPFPPEMKAIYPEIKFAYEWQFLAK